MARLMRKKLEARFPTARIKKIMQMDEDVGKIAQATPYLVSRALELFLEDLSSLTMEVTTRRGAKMVTVGHLKECVAEHNEFDFLRDMVSKHASTPESEVPTPKATSSISGRSASATAFSPRAGNKGNTSADTDWEEDDEASSRKRKPRAAIAKLAKHTGSQDVKGGVFHKREVPPLKPPRKRVKKESADAVSASATEHEGVTARNASSLGQVKRELPNELQPKEVHHSPPVSEMAMHREFFLDLNMPAQGMEEEQDVTDGMSSMGEQVHKLETMPTLFGTTASEAIDVPNLLQSPQSDPGASHQSTLLSLQTSGPLLPEEDDYDS